MLAWHVYSLLIWVGLCALQDARTRQISNVLTLGGAALAAVYLLLAGQSWLGGTQVQAVTAFCVTLLLTVPGYWLRQLGAADVKLLAFIALASELTVALLTVAGAGLFHCVWIYLQHSSDKEGAGKIRGQCRQSSVTNQKKPFAPMIWLGLVLALWLTY